MEKRIHKMEQKKYVLFYCGLTLILCNDLFTLMWLNNILSGGIGLISGLILLSAKVLLDFCDNNQQSRLDIIIQTTLLGVGTITFVSTKQKEMLVLSLIVVAARNVDFKSISKLFILIISTTYILNLSLVFLGLKKTEIIDVGAPGHRLQSVSSLGFVHSGNVGLIWLCILLCYILLNNKLDKNVLIFFGFVGGIIYIITDARMVFYLLVLLLILLLINKTKLKAIFKNNILAVTTAVFCPLFMVIVGIIADGQRISDSAYFNTLVSRFAAWGIAASKCGIHPFGIDFQINYPVDPGYYKIIFRYGYVSLAAFILSYVIVILRKKEDSYYGIVCMIISLLGMVEYRFFSSYFLLPLIGLFAKTSCNLGNAPHEKEKELVRVNYGVIGSIITLIVLHGIYQYARENWIVRTIVNVVRVTDILFIIIGFLLGTTIFTVKQNIAQREQKME